MAMRKWSVIEDELKKAQFANDPRLLRYMGEVHERLREHHQMNMLMAETMDKMMDVLNQVTVGQGAVNAHLEKIGMKPQLQQLEGDPDETGSTYHTMRDEPKKSN